MTPVEKAIIAVYDKKSGTTKDAFYVQFNPNEISISESAGRLAKKNVSVPKKNKAAKQQASSEEQAFNFNESRSITFTTKLFFNTYNSASDYSDVRSLINRFDCFLNKKVEKAEDLKKISFMWGSIQIFGLLTAMNVSYTMFSPGGFPVRAEASITIAGDYIGYKLSPPPKDKDSFTFVDESGMGFAAALAAYGSISALKAAARISGVVNLRTLA
jgi:hypothetical protein